MRAIGCLLLSGLAAGCAAETGQSLQILGALAPSTTCTFDSASTIFRSSGSYDPRGYGMFVPDGYAIGLKVDNQLVTPTQDPANTTGNRNTRNPANDIAIAGVEACWDLASRHLNATAFDNGLAFDCGSLPDDQREFITASTTATAGGLAVVVASVLQPRHLRAAGIFGADFDPQSLPTTAIQTTTILGPSFSLPVTQSSDTPPETRSPAWGGFPRDALNTARVLVQVRAVGKTQTGIPEKSNWLVYPIDVTPGALATACDPTPAQGVCPAPAGATIYFGNFVNVGGSCLPGMGGSVSCFAVTTCPTTTP